MLSEVPAIPNADEIRKDLRFMTARWGELGIPVRFELRALQPDRDAVIGKFSLEMIDEAVDWAERLNEMGWNIYAVRNPIHANVTRSATDPDIAAAFYLWADCDTDTAAGNVLRFDGPKWSAAVITGTVPSHRAHTYWELETACTDMAAWTGMQKQVAAHFQSDRTVYNASRIMRVGGTVSYPADNKQKRGYIKELTTIRTEYADARPRVTLEQMARVFGEQKIPDDPPPNRGQKIDTGEYDSKSVDDYAEILRQARTDGEKHVGIRGLMASLAGSGVPIPLAEAWGRELFPTWDENAQKLLTSAYQKYGSIIRQTAFVDDDENENWQADLVVNSKGRAVFNVANAMLVIENDPELRDCFAFDEFRQCKIVTAPPPGSRARKTNFQGRDYRDSDTIQVVSYFNRNGFPEATKNTIADAIDTVAETATFHPVRNYFSDLPEWDGVERIDTWLQDYCNVQPSSAEETEYVREVGAKWLISAVARVMKPGCKADGVLILEGSQGARKSTTLRFLAGEDWFGDSLPPMASKDASDYLRGKWIIEMAELSNINKAEVEVVKAFISREEERFRPAYARSEITYQRQCVFAGSTNKGDYLRDETGNRRFWPVKVNGLCDTAGIKKDRDQIWAEAYHRYKGGSEWWLSAHSEEIAKAEQGQRVSQDAWQGDVERHCLGKREISATDVAINGLGIEIARIDRICTNRITAILSSIGYVRKGQFTSGANKGRAKYVRDGAQ